jgi:hypothetical protein
MPCITAHTLCSDTSMMCCTAPASTCYRSNNPLAAAACVTIRHLFYLVHLLYRLPLVFMIYCTGGLLRCAWVYLSCKHATRVYECDTKPNQAKAIAGERLHAKGGVVWFCLPAGRRGPSPKQWGHPTRPCPMCHLLWKAACRSVYRSRVETARLLSSASTERFCKTHGPTGWRSVVVSLGRSAWALTAQVGHPTRPCPMCHLL